MGDKNVLAVYLGAFIDELYAHGIKDVVISPGSRSTPLALLFANHEGINTYVHVDERSAAFFALGIAKKTNRAVGLVCTSGTAAANYMPAICEAHASRVPLIVMTADRPHELRDIGAPQTMNQLNMYNQFIKLFIEAAIPEDEIVMYHYVRTIAAKSYKGAMSKPFGPVHINMPFRDPLVPNLHFLDKWSSGKRKNGVCQTVIGEQHLNDEQKQEIISLLTQYEKGIIICGPNEHEYDANAVVMLANALGYPILADPLSKLRTGSHDKRRIIDCYDTFLRHEQINKQVKPDVVIRVGGMPVSKVLTNFLKESNPIVIVVDEGESWRDPLHVASFMVACNPNAFCKQLCEEISNLDDKYAKQWHRYNEDTKTLLKDHLNMEEHIEGAVVTTIAKSILPKTNLFVSNSMPIRDVDSFFYCLDEDVTIYGNRGVNGIDGVVSTALGVATQGERVVLLIGDLSFYHDLNGLLAAKLYEMNVTIVVVNNDGGGIFSFLPQANESMHFEKVFGTPLGLDYQHVVQMYGGQFFRTETMDEFQTLMNKCQRENGLHVIEVISKRDDNLTAHRQLWDTVVRGLSSHE
ncbi:MAG: 2-succinyl-5-enolpyruvyl-6-hydroxy-3-cyclohexene-1-carboxylic-acid synthase [Bacillaceae bacterium]